MMNEMPNEDANPTVALDENNRGWNEQATEKQHVFQFFQPWMAGKNTFMFEEVPMDFF